jgi:purine-nucleoside phosphorylase
LTARLPRGDAAIVFGSGLALLPEGAEVLDEIDYTELRWPATTVAGHANRLLVTRWAPDGRTELRVLLACGRPHPYEGWSDAELARPVDDLADCGVRALLLTNASGALDATFVAGTAVIVTQVVDLQTPPLDEPAVLTVSDEAEAQRLAGALTPRLPARPGRYVAVPGPHYETAAEAAWLRAYGDVVGMSTVAEVRVASRRGLPVCVLSLVANAAGAALDHAEVLAGGARLAAGLAGGLGPLAAAFMARAAPPARGGCAVGGGPA